MLARNLGSFESNLCQALPMRLKFNCIKEEIKTCTGVCKNTNNWIAYIIFVVDCMK